MRVNPPASVLGSEHAVLHGHGRDYAIRHFAGPLSIKTVRRGSALWRIGNTERVLGPGLFLIINEGEPYDIEIDSIDSVETFCVFFRAGFAEEIARVARSSERSLLDAPDASGAAQFIQTIERTTERVRALLERIEECALRSDDGTDRLIELVESLLDCDSRTRGLVGSVPATRPSTREEILRRVLLGRDRIESAWNTRISLEDIARHAGMAPYHFHRNFRTILGTTPLDYLTRLRIEQARRLLRETDQSLQDICVAIGLESLPSFVHRFRESSGTTPGRYRAAVRKIR